MDKMLVEMLVVHLAGRSAMKRVVNLGGLRAVKLAEMKAAQKVER